MRQPELAQHACEPMTDARLKPTETEFKKKPLGCRTIAASGIGIAIVLVIVLVIPLLKSCNGKRVNDTKDQNVSQQNAVSGESNSKEKPVLGERRQTQITAIRLSPDQKYIDKINANTPEGQVVFEGERSRLEILLPTRSYLMVLGITPNNNDDKVICLWPKNTSTPSQYCDGFIYGKRTAEQLTIKFTFDHDIAVREGTWKYSDGPGLHAFIVISSQTLLPSFDEVRDDLLKIDWPIGNVSPKHWTIRDNEAFVHEFNRFVARGADDTSAFAMQPVVNQIKSLFYDAQIDGIVFNVEKNTSGD